MQGFKAPQKKKKKKLPLLDENMSNIKLNNVILIDFCLTSPFYASQILR